MRQDTKLTLSMGILFLIVFVAFGVIIINDKLSIYLKPKINTKLNNYLKEKHPDILEDIKIKPITYKNTIYTLKIVSKKNKNLYFNINYQNKKISDTYKKDYLEGLTILTKITKKIENKINKKSNYKVKVKINKNLNEFSTPVREKIIEEKNILNLKIYDIYIERNIKDFTTDSITNEILNIYNKFTEENITPKTYNLTITNKKDITEAIKINNITDKLMKSDDLKLVINDIMNNKKSDILAKYNITYEYLN